MFLLTLIKPSDVTGKNEVHVVEPILESRAHSDLTINSVNNKKFNRALWSGSQEQLSQFVNSISNKQVGWSSDSPTDILGYLRQIADSSGVSFENTWRDEVCAMRNVCLADVMIKLRGEGLGTRDCLNLTRHVERFNSKIKVGGYVFGYEQGGFYDNVTSAANKPPGINRFPLYMNEDAKKVWQYVIKTYKKSYMDPINKSKSKTDKDALIKSWQIAIIIFRRACVKAKVVPFMDVNPASKLNEQMTEDIRAKVEKMNDLADTKIDTIENDLIRNGLVDEIGLELKDRCKKEGSSYVFKTVRKVKLEKGIKPLEVIKYLQVNWGFKPARGHSLLKLDGIHSIRAAIEDKKKLVIYWVSALSQQQAGFLVEEPSLKGDKLLAKMNRLMLDWFSTEKLKFKKKK